MLAAIRYSADWGAVNLTGAVGRYDDGGQNVSTHALHVGAHVNVSSATRVMATLNMTRGDGQIYGAGDVTGMDASGELKAYDAIGGFAGVSHGWTDSIRSGVYYGWAENDNPALMTDGEDPVPFNKRVQTVHANVIWSPVPAADIGFEVIYGLRETNSGAEGEATRFQIGIKVRLLGRQAGGGRRPPPAPRRRVLGGVANRHEAIASGTTFLLQSASRARRRLCPARPRSAAHVHVSGSFVIL